MSWGADKLVKVAFGFLVYVIPADPDIGKTLIPLVFFGII